MTYFNKTYTPDQILKVLTKDRHMNQDEASEMLFLIFNVFKMSEEPALYQEKTMDPIRDSLIEALDLISNTIDGFIAGIDERLDYYKNENMLAGDNLSSKYLTEYVFGYFYIGMNYFWKECFNQKAIIDESIEFNLETCNQFPIPYLKYQNDAAMRLALHSITDDRIRNSGNAVGIFPKYNKIIREYFDKYFEPSDHENLSVGLFSQMLSIEGIQYYRAVDYLFPDESQQQQIDYTDHIMKTFLLLKIEITKLVWKDYTIERYKEISAKYKWEIANGVNGNAEAIMKFFTDCDIIFNAQRPEDEDYGLCASNAICTSSFLYSELFLDNLRTEDGRAFMWHPFGACLVEDVDGVKNVEVHIYLLFLEGKEYKKIFICPYGRDSAYVPKGFKLADK